MTNNAEKLMWSLMTAAFLGLAGWVYTTGNRVTALEAKGPGLEERLAQIQQDVRDIRHYLLGR